MRKRRQRGRKYAEDADEKLDKHEYGGLDGESCG